MQADVGDETVRTLKREASPIEEVEQRTKKRMAGQAYHADDRDHRAPAAPEVDADNKNAHRLNAPVDQQGEVDKEDLRQHDKGARSPPFGEETETVTDKDTHLEHPDKWSTGKRLSIMSSPQGTWRLLALDIPCADIRCTAPIVR